MRALCRRIAETIAPRGRPVEVVPILAADGRRLIELLEAEVDARLGHTAEVHP